MKKQYEAPKAEKVEFNYDEMVTASGAAKETGTKCINPCTPSKETGSKCINPCGGWGWPWW